MKLVFFLLLIHVAILSMKGTADSDLVVYEQAKAKTKKGKKQGKGASTKKPKATKSPSMGKKFKEPKSSKKSKSPREKKTKGKTKDNKKGKGKGKSKGEDIDTSTVSINIVGDDLTCEPFENAPVNEAIRESFVELLDLSDLDSIGDPDCKMVLGSNRRLALFAASTVQIIVPVYEHVEQANLQVLQDDFITTVVTKVTDTEHKAIISGASVSVVSYIDSIPTFSPTLFPSDNNANTKAPTKFPTVTLSTLPSVTPSTPPSVTPSTPPSVIPSTPPSVPPSTLPTAAPVSPVITVVGKDGELYKVFDQYYYYEYTYADDYTVAINGDGGQATAAVVNGLQGVAVDSNNNIFVTVGSITGTLVRWVNSTTGVIDRYAGTGVSRGTIDFTTGPATSIDIYWPGFPTFDSLGNLYFTELRGTSSHTVRKVERSTSLMSVVAGSGSGGYNGDGIQATAAQLRNIGQTFVTTSGDIYICDRKNGRIRKVDGSSKVISTVIGDGSMSGCANGVPATSCSLIFNGVAVNSIGEVYISALDFVSKKNITGVMTTVAGIVGIFGFSGDGGDGTNAKFSLVKGLAITATGVLYIADRGNNRIRKLDTTGIVTTVAGTGSSGFNGDGLAPLATNIGEVYDLSLSTDDSQLYYADRLHERVKKFGIA